MSDDSEAGDDVESDNNGSFVQTDVVIRRSCCRYGSGCTHIFDPSHRDRFWHPSPPKLNNEQLKSQFICNECGYATSQLQVLQVHLQRKTAWSNSSLVGCRINCLIDLKEWHEGFVLQFHKSGKHYVEFRQANEKRWLIMKKITFYILERPVAEGKEESECKEDETDGLAPLEDNWVYCEDISLDYTFAQSVLFKIYGNSIQETGHLTKGHTCLTDADRLNAQYVKGSLLYGELLPRGANKAFGVDRLNASSASVLFDLGMGTGKILIQAFLQFKNLRYIFGIELSSGRYKIAEEALLRMVQLLGEENYHVQVNPGRFIIVTEVVRLNDEIHTSFKKSTSGKEEKSEDDDSIDGMNDHEEMYVERVLHLQCGNMFDVKNINSADVVMMETDIPSDQHGRLQNLLGQMKPEARVLTYLDLRRIWQNTGALFRQVDVNRHQTDRYPTSWSVQRGHHFYLWIKVRTFSEDAPDNNHNANSNAWLPQLHHPQTPANHSTRGHVHNSDRAGGPTESPITIANSPQRLTLSQQHHNSSSNKNNSTQIGTQQTGCLPWQWWFAGRGQSQRSANAKIVKKVMTIEEFERNQAAGLANQSSVSPSNNHVDMVMENNSHYLPISNTRAPNGQIETLNVPQTQPVQSSKNDHYFGSTGTGTNTFNLSPRSGRVSPQLSPTFSISPDSNMHLSARHTTHSSSPVHTPPPDSILPLLSVDELQFGHHHRSSSKRSNKHKHKNSSAGTDSAKSKSPRESRESKKKHKASRTSSRDNASIDIRTNLSPRSRTSSKGSSFSPGNTVHTEYVPNSSSPAAVNTVSEIVPYSPEAVLSLRDTSSVYLQHSAAMGAIDGMHSTYHSPHNNTTLPYSPIGHEHHVMSANSRSHNSRHSDSPAHSPRKSSAASLEAHVWQESHYVGTNSAVHYVAQDLVSTETITGQASAGARVLVQQMNNYGPSLHDSEINAIGRSGKNRNILIDNNTSGKPRSYRIHNTIPVRAHPSGDLSINNQHSIPTNSGVNSSTGKVIASPTRVHGDTHHVHNNTNKSTSGCTLM